MGEEHTTRLCHNLTSLDSEPWGQSKTEGERERKNRIRERFSAKLHKLQKGWPMDPGFRRQEIGNYELRGGRLYTASYSHISQHTYQAL